jgi:hypothetical protein
MKSSFLIASAAMMALGGAAHAQETTPSSPGATTPDVVPAGEATPTPGGAPTASGSSVTPPTTTDDAPSTTSPGAGAPQTGATPGMTAPTTTAPTTTAPTTTDAPPPAGPTASSTAPAAPADAGKMQAAQAAVEAGWAKYDTTNSGKLNALQFGTWIMAASGQDIGAQVEKTKASKSANLPAVKVLNATASEFFKADTDRDRAVSREELTAYLSA